MFTQYVFFGICAIMFFSATMVKAQESTMDADLPTVDEDLGKSRDALKTDDETAKREEEAIKIDGLSVAQMKEMRDKAEKHTFQTEVDRMMKLIINSLYRNKEIFLRELISNASDALDKVRFLALTDKTAMSATPDLTIKIKADKENNVLHITDTGIGMTQEELIKNLGTIAKSGTSDFLAKAGAGGNDMGDLIGQFGVGFYSTFLVADRVVVTSKSQSDEQYIWESDAKSFSIAKDPRGNTLPRGTTISLYMKEEASDFLEQKTIKDLVTRYSQFITFNIYLWDSEVETVEEPIEDEAKPEETKPESEDDEAKVEEEKEAPKTKKVEKTTWDWKLVNDNKPLWTRKISEISDEDYNEFYKSYCHDKEDPMARSHFVAEGEVTFKSLLFLPKVAPKGGFDNYGKKVDNIKMYVRRVFITDNFEEMMPKYLSFVRGLVDSDDLPLNVSREQLQQHKLLKVIKKKLVRKTLDMFKKISKEEYLKFWAEYSTNIKLGVMEDHANRTRLAKLLRFFSSNSETEYTSLVDYVDRMKDKQEHIYFIAGTSRAQVESSPFVERLLKKGYEVLYLVEAVDEYCIQALPEFDSKKFQNVAKDGLKMDESSAAKEKNEVITKEFEPLTKWLVDTVLKDYLEKAVISTRLTTSPCAIVAGTYGWSGNMERIMSSQTYQKHDDTNNKYYASQKRILELNPRHPLVKKLLNRFVENGPEDSITVDLANVLFETATLRSNFQIKDTTGFAGRIERMLRMSMDIPLDEKIEDEPEEEINVLEQPIEESQEPTDDSEDAEDVVDPIEEKDEL